MQKILFIRLGRIGDIVLTLPAIAAVQAAFPEASLAFLVYAEFASLLKGLPRINAVLKVDRARHRRNRLIAITRETVGLLRELRRSRFDLVIDFHGFGETALFSWWTRAPQRWGILNRPGRAWAYTRSVQRNPLLHPASTHLEMLNSAGGIKPAPFNRIYTVPEEALTEARNYFRKWDLSEFKPTLFIQPFSSDPLKNWPLDGYLAIAAHWKSQGVQVLFGGGPAESQALEPARHAGYAVAAGAPLLVSAGLVSLSSLVLGGNTGLLHLATALEKRVVMIMDLLQPGACFPFGHPEWAVVPESGWVVSSIKPAAVVDACGHAFAEITSQPAVGTCDAQLGNGLSPAYGTSIHE